MKNILKRIGLIAVALFLCLGSLFITTPFNSDKSNFAFGAVSAPDFPQLPTLPPSVGDSTTIDGVAFLGSNITIGGLSYSSTNSLVNDFSFYSSSSAVNKNKNPITFKFGLNVSDNTLYFNYSAYYPDTCYIFPNGTTYLNPNAIYKVAVGGVDYSSFASSFSSGDVFDVYGVTPMQSALVAGASSYSYINFGFEIYKNNVGVDSYIAPNFDMFYCVLINSYQLEEFLGITPKYSNSNIVCYIDTNGYYYLYYIPSFMTSGVFYDNGGVFFDYRFYILKDVEMSDNQFYQQGVNDGYSAGLSAGEGLGYDVGFVAGEEQGYIRGKIDGANNAGEFTFLGLMTAVVDAPLLAFTSLFDFDLLGVNLLGFFIGLFTFSLVIIIAKFAIGGK